MPVLCSHILSRSVWPHKLVSFSAKHRSLVYEVIFFFFFWFIPTPAPWHFLSPAEYLQSMNVEKQHCWEFTVPRRQRVVFTVYDLDFVHPVETHLDVVAPRCRREILFCFLLPWPLAVESKPSLVLLLIFPFCLPLGPFLPSWGDSAYWTHSVYFFLHFCHHGSNSSWNLIFFLICFWYIFSIGNWAWQCATELGWCGVRHSPCMSLSSWGWISWTTGSGEMPTNF